MILMTPVGRRSLSTSGGAFVSALKTPMLPTGTFDGQVALVTGGGTGLGASMAEMLSHLGCRVCITSRKLDVLNETAEKITSKTGNAVLAVACDVRDPAAVAHALDEVSQRFDGRTPNLVINNAAGNFISPFERLTPGGWKAVTDIVLNGTAFVTHEAGRRMIKAGTGGVFLNITTTYADTGSAYVAPSAAAKAGVANLTKSLAAEWGKYGIRLNAISPGPIMTKGAFSRLDPTGRFQSLLTNRLPAKRLGEREELANLACYLLSPYASWMTGSIVMLDGGESAALAGEFNALEVVTPEQWDALEAAGRKAGKSGE